MRCNDFKQGLFCGTVRWLFLSLLAAVIAVLYLDVPETQAVIPGDLYVSSWFNHKVLRYNGTTGALVGDFATLPDITGAPFGITFGPDGNLYVGDSSYNKVVRFNGSTGAYIDDFVTAGADSPQDLVFGPDGKLYVTSYNGSKIVRYNGSTGTLIGDFVTASSGGLNGPTGLVFGPDGNLYVSSSFGPKVIRYSGSTGALIGDFATDGLSTQIQGLAFGPDGNMYVSSGSSNVVRFNGTTGALIGDFVAAGIGGLSVSIGLVFGPDANLYVSSLSNNKIIKYNGTTGAVIGDFVTSGLGGLNGPTFLTFGPIYYDITETPTGSGSVICTPNPAREMTDSLCVMAPSLNYHVTDVLVGPSGSPAVSVGPLWTYSFQNVTEDKTIDASFAENNIWLFKGGLQDGTTLNTSIGSALSQAYANLDDKIRIESGAYFEGSGTGVACSDDFGTAGLTLSGGWTSASVAGTKPTVITPKLTISGSCRLIVDEITIQ